MFDTSCSCGVGDKTVKYDRVYTNYALPGHYIMDSLEHWPIVVEVEDIALDPASNAMYVPKSGTGFEPTVLFSAVAPMMVIYSIKRRRSL